MYPTIAQLLPTYSMKVEKNPNHPQRDWYARVDTTDMEGKSVLAKTTARETRHLYKHG